MEEVASKDSPGLDVTIHLMPCDELYEKDKNILVATWINDFGYPQKIWDDKILFYNSEKILNRENILDHFKRDNKKQMQDVEYVCRKGNNNIMNQDNFFVIQDGDCKIFGIFDGHGLNGHNCSSFAMGAMVDFLKNRKNKPDFNKASNEEIEKLMRKCFRYAQDKLKEQFKEHLTTIKASGVKL